LLPFLSRDVPNEEVKAINLNAAQLTAIMELDRFSHIECLTLRGNSLRSVESVKLLKKLRLLDVRENKIQSISEVADIANKLEKLEVLAALDNPFSLLSGGPKVVSKYRSTFMSMVPKLKKMDNILLFLDDVEMTAEEIVKSAFPSAKSDADRTGQGQWVWAVSVWRQVGQLISSFTGLNFRI
jgi:Leucine-rich repeat (LRR) protein